MFKERVTVKEIISLLCLQGVYYTVGKFLVEGLITSHFDFSNSIHDDRYNQSARVVGIRGPDRAPKWTE